MKKEKNDKEFFPKSSDLKDVEQWFPNQPAKSSSKWTFMIALLDEISIFAILLIMGYIIFMRFV